MTLAVGIVARCLNVRHVRGMGRYVFELLRQSPRRPDVEWTVYGHNPSLPLLVPEGFGGRQAPFEFRGDRFQLWEQVGLPLRARADRKVEILHCTEGALPWWQPRPTVVTLHDTILWDEDTPNRAMHHYIHRVLPAALRRSAAVITISESSRRDILARWPQLEAKLHVVPHGISEEFFSTEAAAPHAALNETIGSASYIVYVGGPVPRKRFDWALKLLAQCGRPDLQLIACGFDAKSLPRNQVPEELHSRVHFAPFLTDAELIALYRRAAAVLYPTLYEGFGFPAIEAQVAGAPVLFSPVSSLAELIGPLAWPVEAQSMESWINALEDVLALSADERRTRSQEAREWGRTFSWGRSFDRHLDVYAAALGRSSAS